jgi:type II secretory pathway pseudopilin PulG
MRGHTLIELLLVLTLLGASTASLAPVARRYRDRSSVVAAREAVVGLLSEARLAAMEAGSARLALSSEPTVARVLIGDSTVRTVDLDGQYGVSLEMGGGRTDTELVFDALGLGRMAAQTIGVHRGDASAELVVSAYGRVRRQ